MAYKLKGGSSAWCKQLQSNRQHHRGKNVFGDEVVIANAILSSYYKQFLCQ